MVSPILRHRHHSSADDENKLAFGQISFSVKLLPYRTTTNTQRGRMQDAVAAESPALAHHPAAPPLGDPRAGGACPVLALAGGVGEPQAHVVAGVQELLVAFEARVHG